MTNPVVEISTLLTIQALNKNIAKEIAKVGLFRGADDYARLRAVDHFHAPYVSYLERMNLKNANLWNALRAASEDLQAASEDFHNRRLTVNNQKDRDLFEKELPKDFAYAYGVMRDLQAPITEALALREKAVNDTSEAYFEGIKTEVRKLVKRVKQILSANGFDVESVDLVEVMATQDGAALQDIIEKNGVPQSLLDLIYG